MFRVAGHVFTLQSGPFLVYMAPEFDDVAQILADPLLKERIDAIEVEYNKHPEVTGKLIWCSGPLAEPKPTESTNDVLSERSLPLILNDDKSKLLLVGDTGDVSRNSTPAPL